MTAGTKMGLDRDYISKFSEQQGEPSWLQELRLQAYDQSQALKLPHLEKTRIDSWNLLQFSADSSETEEIASLEQLPSSIRSLLEEDNQSGNLIIHKNSSLIYQGIEEQLQNKGVIYTDIRTALRQHSDLLQKYLHKIVTANEHQISAYHMALMNAGIFLYVPKNVEIELPIQSLFWNEQGSHGLFPHILIVAEANSKVTYVENLIGHDQGISVNNYAAEVYVGPGAKVTFAAVDQLGKETTSYIYRRALVEQDGRIDWALGQMNNGNTVSDNTTLLKGNGSVGDTKSVVVGTGTQSLNFVQKMHQFGHYTEGQMLSHGVMKDEARAIFNGITKIEKGAFKSTGEQSERVLMLNKKARGDANPILLIDENVERAGHAASVGQVDPVQLFYLMSRGISQEEAERLIILGFLNPVIEEIPLEGLRKRLIEVIERKVKS